MGIVAQTSSQGFLVVGLLGGMATAYCLGVIAYQIIWLERYIRRRQFHLAG